MPDSAILMTRSGRIPKLGEGEWKLGVDIKDNAAASVTISKSVGRKVQIAFIAAGFSPTQPAGKLITVQQNSVNKVSPLAVPASEDNYEIADQPTPDLILDDSFDVVVSLAASAAASTFGALFVAYRYI